MGRAVGLRAISSLALGLLLSAGCTKTAPSTSSAPATGVANPRLSNESANTRSLVFNVQAYGAAGDGTSDDTQAIQSAINAAEVDGGIVFFPQGRYTVSAQLSITKGVTIRGVTSWTPSLSLQSSSCIVQTNPKASTFAASTGDAVAFEQLCIQYPSAVPYSGAAAIEVLGPNDNNSGGNTQSLVRDSYISGADRGIVFQNSASWIVNNNLLSGMQTYGVLIDSDYNVSWASHGDWGITGNTFSQTSRNGDYAHIAVWAGAGGRVVNNVMESSGFGYGILVAPAHSLQNFQMPSGQWVTTYNIEPLVVTANVIQGPRFGIGFVPAPGTNGTATYGVISSNQINAWIPIYSQAAPVTQPGALPPNSADGVHAAWVSTWSMSGNTLSCQDYCLYLDGVADINIVGNIFYLAASGAQDVGFGPSVFYTGPPTATGTLRSAMVQDNTIVTGAPALSSSGMGATVPSRLAGPQGLIGYTAATTFSVKDYGALGDGATDDTRAIQKAIDAAQAGDGTVFFPAGKYIISSTLSITGAVTVQGVGYRSAGSEFVTTFAPNWLDLTTLNAGSAVIQTNPAASIFYVAGGQAVQILSLELFFYNAGGKPLNTAQVHSGASAIVLSGGNDNSLLRDLFIYGGDNGIAVAHSSGWVVDNVLFYDCLTYGLYVDGTAADSGGWQITNSTFESGSIYNYSHFYSVGGGGGRIIGNKLNAAGCGSQCGTVGIGVAIGPQHSSLGDFPVDPIQIIGNSMEGEPTAAIAFLGTSPNDAVTSGGAIVGNQIWAATDVWSTAGPTIPQWIRNWSITGNLLAVVGGTGAANISMDGVSGLTLNANTFSESFATGTVATQFGANTSAISATANLATFLNGQ